MFEPSSAWVLLLAFVQNVSFSIVGRSRNRDNMAYHLLASVAGNGVWFATMRELLASDMSAAMAVPYVAGSVVGSICGVKVSMVIERWLGAASDRHIR